MNLSLFETEQLTLIERSELEQQIEAALHEWALSYTPKPEPRVLSSQKEMGEALKAIRDQRLYREQASNFYVYCARKWGFPPERVSALIRLTEVSEITSSVEASEPETKQDFVYFLSYGDAVKIGYSNDIDKRVKSIRLMSPVPLTLIGVIPGGKDKEHELHMRFYHQRKHGEWFSLTGELKHFIERAFPNAQ